MNDRATAEREYKIAIDGLPDNPTFKHNLARLFFEEPIFSRKRLEEARSLMQEAQANYKVGSRWESFREYTDHLLTSLNILLTGRDLKDGDPLDADPVFEPDPEAEEDLVI